MTDESLRLRALFQQRTTLSQGQFGRTHGIGAASMVWQYLSGRRRLGLVAAGRFARGLGVDLAQISPRLADELRELTDGITAAGPSDAPRNYAQIPRVTLVLSAGSSRFHAKPLGPSATFIAFRKDWLAERGYAAQDLLAVECNDDAMRPTLALGDLIVINVSKTVPAESAVFAVNYEGQLRVRRLFRDAGAWWLLGDNVVPQRFISRQIFDKHCYLIGQVVHRQSETI